LTSARGNGNGTPRSPAAPKTLGAAGKAAWTLAWAQRWVEAPDRRQVEHLCRLEDEAEMLCAELDRDGATLTKPMITPRGAVVGEERYPHPALKSLRQLDKELRELRRSLGMDPQSRARLRLKAEEGPCLLDLLARKREARLKGQSTAELDRRYAELKAGTMTTRPRRPSRSHA
jgi:P27 family predicted phage terminase small subunit